MQTAVRLVICHPLLLAGLFACNAGPAVGQDDAPDTILLRAENRGTPDVIRGTIVDYNSERIIVRSPYSRTERSYPTATIVEVSTPQTNLHLEGLQQLERGDSAAAETALLGALDEELRPWVRREILALLVRCALWRGDYETAGSRFLTALGSDPHLRHVHLIPLVWVAAPGEAESIEAASPWMASQLEAAQLLGAAGLLFDPVHGREAEEVLERLVRSLDARIRWLAQAQLWRKRSTATEPGLSELQWWAERIEDMPADIRGGPYYVLGEALFQNREYDRAARALLWCPLVYPHDTHLAGRATLRAADALLRVGQDAEAVTLYRETAQRFADTPFAEQATRKLAALSSEQAATKQRR